jgi:UDP-N-acetylmuramoylalanine--D-glutamate ligase
MSSEKSWPAGRSAYSGPKSAAPYPISNTYAALRVVILGLARQGLATARFFLAAGAQVTVSDLRPAGQLAAASAALQAFAAEHNASLRLVLGGHPLDLLEECDLLCLSGGVSPALPLVQQAVRRGIPLSNDGQLTLRHCPVPIIGITGSAGKTTTTTLTGLMLEAAGFRVHVGGNIGIPLLDRLADIKPGDKGVMELSSFQLELFDRSPAIAALLNITPNHLDRHASMSHYAAAKANILRWQEGGDACILGADDDYTGPWLREGRCRIAAGAGQEAIYFPLRASRWGFSLTAEVEAGGFLQGDRLILRRPGLGDTLICRAGEVRLRGPHNLANILAASSLAAAAGADVAALQAVATTFGGVEHRLEIVRERGGVLWVNDSIATAPERLAAALRSFTEPIILLAGGRDKNLPWAEAAALMCERCRHVVLFGEAAGLIGEALVAERGAAHPAVPSTRCVDLPAAVAAANRLARPGDVVLLAPGGTSFDAYADFAARGAHFRALVEALP